jgi:hypothetical protein
VVFEEVVSVVLQSFVVLHPHSREVVGVTETVVGCLVVRSEQP